MNKLQLLRHSYSGRLEAYWNSHSITRQRVLVLIVFTCYTLVCLLIVKTSFTSKIKSNSQELQSKIKPVKYLFDRQKTAPQLTIKIKNYESQSIR